MRLLKPRDNEPGPNEQNTALAERDRARIALQASRLAESGGTSRSDCRRPPESPGRRLRFGAVGRMRLAD